MARSVIPTLLAPLVLILLTVPFATSFSWRYRRPFENNNLVIYIPEATPGVEIQPPYNRYNPYPYPTPGIPGQPNTDGYPGARPTAEYKPWRQGQATPGLFERYGYQGGQGTPGMFENNPTPGMVFPTPGFPVEYRRRVREEKKEGGLWRRTVDLARRRAVARRKKLETERAAPYK
jgi:hypothetical protein